MDFSLFFFLVLLSKTLSFVFHVSVRFFNVFSEVKKKKVT